MIHQGMPTWVKSAAAWSSIKNKPSAIRPEGTFAPVIVTQKTAASSSSMRGRPKIGEVTRRSMRWSRSHFRCAPLCTARRVMRFHFGVERLDDLIAKTAFQARAQQLGPVENILGVTPARQTVRVRVVFT